MEQALDIFSCFFGLFFIIKYKYLGKISIEQRKKLNHILPFPQSEKDFGNTAIVLNQIAFLLLGIIFLIGGLVDLFS